MNFNPKRVLLYRKAPLPGEIAGVAPQHMPAQQIDGTHVGIWDLDVSAGALPGLLDRIDECQSRFTFSIVEAPFPTGLTLPGPHVAQEWLARTGQRMDSDLAQLNVSARAILATAKPVLKQLPIQWLVVVVKSMISDTTDRNDSWHNLFSTQHGNIVVASTFGLREYAAQAGRSFESAVMGVALPALLAAMVPNIEYQMATTGSIFDFCENRADIVKSIRSPHIDPQNRVKIPRDVLEPVENILSLLSNYKGRPPMSQVRGTSQKKTVLKGPSLPTHKPSEASWPVRDVGKTPPNSATEVSVALAKLNASLCEMSSAAPTKPLARNTVPKRPSRPKQTKG